MSKPLIERRKLFDELKEIMHSKFVRFSCPCCGYPTLDERGGYEICQICWWEDDGQDDSDADIVRGGPNHHYSLTDARKNFKEYLVMYPPEKDTRISGADSEKVRSLKQDLISTFDTMLETDFSDDTNNLWMEVEKIEKALRQNLDDTIKQYEAEIQSENSEEN